MQRSSSQAGNRFMKFRDCLQSREQCGYFRSLKAREGEEGDGDDFCSPSRGKKSSRSSEARKLT